MKSFAGLLGMSLLVAALSPGECRGKDDPDIVGSWEVTTSYAEGSSVAGLELTRDGDEYKGRSGWLVPDWGTFQYTGKREKNAAAVRLVLSYGSPEPIGELIVRNERGTLKGSGTLHGVPISIVGHRPRQRAANAPRVHDFEPTRFYRIISGSLPPALRIFPGDTVRTRTVDARAVDEHDQPRALPGNNATGPFYVEGAMPGDTLAVHFDKIRPNRRWAEQYRGTIYPSVLKPGHEQERIENWSNRWTLDLENGTATPDQPGAKLKHLSIKLQPMLGVVGVAPFWDQVSTAPDLGRWGGNLDYNQIREGTTLYLSVYQAGAMLFMGDGHAVQGDGEITGQGLEISMDVEFTVDVIRGEYLDQPWAENGEYIMVSGIDGSLTTAMQAATSGLAKWLAARFALNAAEIATLLTNCVQYDIAEVVDPHTHVVAKIRKDVLSQISKP